MRYIREDSVIQEMVSDQIHRVCSLCAYSYKQHF